MRCILILILTLFVLCADAQRFVVVQNLNKPKQKKYSLSDEIGVKVKDDKFVLYGEILAIRDSSFVMESDNQIRIPEITKVYDRSRVRTMRGIRISAFSTIPVFFVLTALNNIVNTGDRPVIDNTTWALSGIFGGIGLLTYTIGPKKYPIGNRWKVFALDTRFNR